jgi:hypothetical protein
MTKNLWGTQATTRGGSYITFADFILDPTCQHNARLIFFYKVPCVLGFRVYCSIRRPRWWAHVPA